MNVRFSGVGRSKATFNLNMAQLSERALTLAVRPHLMSRDLSFVVDFDTRTGTVHAGFQAVGTFAWGDPEHPVGCICRDCRFTVPKQAAS